MLGVCSEFERIAKVVLDKAEKDSSSRRKRKNAEEQPKQKPHQNPYPQAPMHPSAMAGVFSPNMQPPLNGLGSSPMNGNMNGSPQPGVWQPDYSNGGDYMTPNANGNAVGMTPFTDVSGYEVNSPQNINSFQQPFVPQDLWQMPMSLEWDWADMTGGVYPSFENGIMGDPTLQHANNQHLQHRM